MRLEQVLHTDHHTCGLRSSLHNTRERAGHALDAFWNAPCLKKRFLPRQLRKCISLLEEPEEAIRDACFRFYAVMNEVMNNEAHAIKLCRFSRAIFPHVREYVPVRGHTLNA